MEFSVRESTKDDLGPIVDTLLEAAAVAQIGFFRADTPLFVAQSLGPNQPDAWTAVACTPAGEVVGFQIMWVPRTEDHLARLVGVDPGRSAHTESAAVRRAFWGHGLQARLIKAGEDAMRLRGHEGFYSLVHPENSRSRGNLERLGA